MTTQTAPALWRHQEEAVTFLDDRPAALLHMGLGTGKSRVAIESAEKDGARSMLILCPLSVVNAWQKQFRLFAPDWIGVYLSSGSVQQKALVAQRAMARSKAMGRPCVVVLNYESARNEPFSDWAMREKFDLLVMDESHRLKSPKGKTSRWVAVLSRTVKKKLSLTGTPMPHSPLDVFAQMRALDPRIFGTSFFKFRRRYAKMGGWGGKQVVGFQNMDELRERMSRLTFQATRDVLDLPEAIHEKRLVRLTPQARTMYDDLERDFCAKVGSGEIVASNALVKLLRLQQITSGSVNIDSGLGDQTTTPRSVDTAKEDALVELLEALPEDEAVVVFGRFSCDMTTVHNAAGRLNRGSLELSGQRKELEAWQAGKAPILTAQIQAGGVGVDLTRAAYCIYLSTGFSLGDFEQSLARCHRPGQDRTVFYYHIVAQDTVDEKVQRALEARKNIVEAVLADIKQAAQESTKSHSGGSDAE